MTTPIAALAAALLLASPPSPPSLDQLVTRYLDALGGPVRLRALKSLRQTGTVKMLVLGLPSDGTFLSETKRPRKSRTEMSAGPVRLLETFDGDKGWTFDLESGAIRPKSADELKEARAGAEFDDWLLDYEKRGVTVEDLGPAQAGKAATRKLKVTFPGGAEHLYIDTTTYLEVRRDQLDADGAPTTQMWTLDYTMVGGLRFASELEYIYANTPARMTLRFEKTEIDPDIPDSRFGPPK